MITENEGAADKCPRTFLLPEKRSVFFDIVSRGHSHVFGKGPVECSDRRKTGGKGNFRDVCSFDEHAAGMLHSETVDEIGKGNAHPLLEDVRNIIFAQVQIFRESIQADGFCVIYGTVGQDAFDAVMASGTGLKIHTRQQFSQDREKISFGGDPVEFFIGPVTAFCLR